MVRTKKKTTNLKRQAKTGEKSIVEVITKSTAVRAQHFEIQDPSERLVATLGATMFSEPRYYPTDTSALKRDYVYNDEDLDNQARMIIQTAMEIAESDSPSDLVKIAHWARTEMRMRTTPQVLLAVAAHMNDTKEFVREYCTKVIRRADEIKQVFAAYRHLFGDQHALPNCLKRGLADTFKRYKERDFLRWEGQHRPYFSDVLKMIDRKKGWPLSPELSHLLNTGEVLDAKKTPLAAARKKLAKCKTFGKQAQELARKGAVNWEVLVSQFGGSQEVWEFLIESEQLPYMATLRNLRNIILAGVSDEHIKMVSKKLVQGAVNSKQLPFRYLSARKVLDQCGQRDVVHQLKGALNGAIDEIVEALDNLPGRSLIAVDTSGSMTQPVSDKSQMTILEAATMLGAIVAKKSEGGSVIGAFGTNFGPLKKFRNTQVITMANQVAALDVGWSTNANRVVEYAMSDKQDFDRIILISDMQSYGGHGGGWGSGGGRKAEGLMDKYRKERNPNCYLHSFDMAGYGKSLTQQGDTKTNLVAGFSEKLLDTIRQFEGLDSPEGEQVFTLEYIRENF